MNMMKKILAIDDTDTNIEILLNLLSDDYDVMAALDGKSALELAIDEKPDLILLDIMMPEMDGYEVCEILKNTQSTAHIPVVFITSKTDSESIEKAYEAGGADYVTKPFMPRELLARVKNQIELKTLIDTLEEKVQIQVNEVLQAKEQMLQNSRMAQMGEMLSMIAHQWRQPLTAISASTLNLTTKIQLEIYDLNHKKGALEFQDKVIVTTHKIEEMVQVLSTIIDDFRNFFKPNKNMTLLSVNIPISKALQIIEASLISENIHIVQELTSSKSIEMYDNELMQVFLNLFKNSQDNFKEKNRENSYIKIHTKDIDNGVEIIFTDNGGGASEDIIEHIFKHYFSTKSEKNGTGLGLSMCKTIINGHHHGNITASNTNDGIAFTITLKDKIID